MNSKEENFFVPITSKNSASEVQEVVFAFSILKVLAGCVDLRLEDCIHKKKLFPLSLIKSPAAREYRGTNLVS